jgi:hypothetical protein
MAAEVTNEAKRMRYRITAGLRSRPRAAGTADRTVCGK